MTRSSGLFGALKERGEELFARVSSELMSNPQFLKAMQGAMKGKEMFDQAASRAMKSMNIPTRSEFKRALSRIEQLEQEVAALKTKPAKRARKSSRAAGG
jgi:hypothetical protein